VVHAHRAVGGRAERDEVLASAQVREVEVPVLRAGIVSEVVLPVPEDRQPLIRGGELGEVELRVRAIGRVALEEPRVPLDRLRR